MKTRTIKVADAGHKMSGYRKLNAKNIADILRSYPLAVDATSDIIFNKSGSFATVLIRPEVYPLVDKDIKSMHKRKGFVYKAKMRRLGQNGKMIVDSDDFLLFYEPFAEEIIVLPAKTAKVKPVHPWWRIGSTLVCYCITQKETVTVSRSFAVKGNCLTAEKDVLSGKVDEGWYRWKHYEPLYFVYHQIPSVEELREME